MSIKVKVHTHQLTANMHKVLVRPMRALANKVVKNKVQRKILNNEIAAVVINATNSALVAERSSMLKNITGGCNYSPFRRMGDEDVTSIEVALRSLVQRFSESEFTLGDSESKEEMDALVTAYNDELKAVKAEDKANIMDIITDATREGVWVGMISYNHDNRYGIEILSPNNDLSEDTGKFGKVAAADLHQFVFDREAYFDKHEKEAGNRRGIRTPNGQFYYSDKLKDFITMDDLKDMKDSKEELRAYNRNYGENDRFNY